MANYIDPAFQIGLMIGNAYGNMWAANAKNRQRNKADDIINEMQNQKEIERIANMRSASADNAAQAIVNDNAQRQATQAAGQITGLGNLGVNKGIDFIGMGAQYNDPYQLSAPSALDTLKSSLGTDRAVRNTIKATADNNAQQASLTPAQRRNANWSPDYTETNVRNRLKQAGINKEVIDEKMPDVKSDIAQRARDVLVPSILQNLYGTVDEKGNYKAPTQMESMKALIDIQTLAQYDPETAKRLSTGAITPRDLYNDQLYDKRYEQRRKDALKDAEEKFQREVALRTIYGAGNRGTRAGKADAPKDYIVLPNGLKYSQEDYNKDAQDYYLLEDELVANGALNPTQQRKYNYLAPRIDAWENYGTMQPQYIQNEVSNTPTPPKQEEEKKKKRKPRSLGSIVSDLGLYIPPDGYMGD